MPTLLRKSVPVDDEQIALLAQLRVPGTPERAAVEDVVGEIPVSASEAHLLRALLSFAEAALRERVLDGAYAAYAVDDEDLAHAAAVRARRDRLHD